MRIYHCYERGGVKVEGSTEAICEGGAGWIRGKASPQMTKGGWDALQEARKAGGNLPAVVPAMAKAFFDLANDGDLVLSNLYEDRFDDYHAKQLQVAFSYAQTDLMVYHYGFPSFVAMPENDAFWARIKPYVDGLAPSYYASNGDNPEEWSSVDYCRMGYQASESKRLIGTSGKRLGFVVSPQTHQGVDILPVKLAKQVQFLDAMGVEVLIMWSARGATPANVAAIKTALTKTATAFAASEQ